MSLSHGMSTHFLASGIDNNNDVRKFLDQVVNLGVDFKSSDKVYSSGKPPTPAVKSFGCMPQSGIAYDDLLSEFADISNKSSNWGSPNFLGFPDSANNVAGLAASLLIPLLNQNMANQDICSPEATFIEMEVVHWLRQTLGYSVPETYSAASTIGGILTLGGCLSNTIALVAAREKLFPGSGLQGLPVLARNVRVLVPDIIEHYSIRSAMAWLSLGEQNVIRVPVDDTFCMDQASLRRIIEQERDNGHHILACVAYAGDSRSMRIDDLDGIAAVLQTYDIWFHVDACHGSQLAFSKRHKHKLRGIEKADSITIDPHKTMVLPYNCSFVLFRDPAAHAATATNSDLILNTQWSLGRVTPFIGSKAFDALKLWATIKFFGMDGLGQIIDDRLDLTNAIQGEIAKRNNLVLMNDTDINSCMMMFVPHEVQQYCHKHDTKLSDSDLEKLNHINRAIKESILQDGTWYIHGFPLKSCPHPDLVLSDKPIYVLRTMNGNPVTTLAHVKGLLDEIERLGKHFVEECEYQFMISDTTNRLDNVCARLSVHLEATFEAKDYAAVIYGSSAGGKNALLSDIGLMIFADEVDVSVCKDLEAMFHCIMEEEGIGIDAEVPFERKLLVSFSTAAKAAIMGPPVDSSGRVLSICKTVEYLASDEMIKRLAFNVLTTPSMLVCSSEVGAERFERSQMVAGRTLFDLIRRVNPNQVNTADEFVRLAISDGNRTGEGYLGYKPRAEVVQKLQRIYADHC